MPHPLRALYRAMVERCYNERHRDWPEWGGRGIVVCDRWRGPGGFARFVADVGPRPSRRHSLDRKENDGPYAPENVRWATARTQVRNSRHVRWLAAGGKLRIQRDWSRATGIKESTISQRRARGWRADRVVRPVDLSVPRGMTRIDLAGQTFGDLTVVRYAGTTGQGHGGRQALWLVRCRCGVEKVMPTRWLRRKVRPVRTCGHARERVRPTCKPPAAGRARAHRP